MKVLAFRNGEAVFEERSSLAVSAACIVANAMRESLEAALGVAVELRLFEPLVPSNAGWAAITADARLYRLRGTRADAAIVVRAHDALAIAGAAFGEFAPAARALSPMEASVLDRIVRAAGRACAVVCGSTHGDVEATSNIAGFATYFELQIERPVVARIGIALSRDPLPDCPQTVALDDLRDLDVECSVRTEGVSMPAHRLAALEPGAIVPITEQTGVLTAVLTLAGRPLARGECGVRGNRLALAICLSPPDEGSAEPES